MKNKVNSRIKMGVMSTICTLLLVIGGLNYFPAKATDGGNLSATYAVTVNGPAQLESTISLNKIVASIEVGQTDELVATTTPSDIEVSWSSSDMGIAIVDSVGNVTGFAVGTTTITATTADDKTATCEVTVTTPTEISLNKTAVSIDLGQTDTLVATITPSDVKASWSSSNTGIATVDSNGKVTSVAVGIATITVTTEDGKTATCEVVVKAQSIPSEATGDRAVLSLTMSNDAIKNYDLSKDELNAFLSWYDAKSKGTAQAYYIFVNKPSEGKLTNKDYIPYDKIEYFNVAEYKAN